MAVPLPGVSVCSQGAVPTSLAGEAAAGEEGAGPAPGPAGRGEGEAPGSAPAAGGLALGFTRTATGTRCQAGKDKRTFSQKQIKEQGKKHFSSDQ